MGDRDIEKLEDSPIRDPRLPIGSPLNEKIESGESRSQVSIHSSGTVSGDEQEVAQRPRPPRSVTSSILPPPIKVRRSARRGLFGRFTILAEVDEPKRYERRTKWFITFMIAIAAAAAPLGSAIFFRMFFLVWYSVNGA